MITEVQRLLNLARIKFDDDNRSEAGKLADQALALDYYNMDAWEIKLQAIFLYIKRDNNWTICLNWEKFADTDGENNLKRYYDVAKNCGCEDRAIQFIEKISSYTDANYFDKTSWGLHYANDYLITGSQLSVISRILDMFPFLSHLYEKIYDYQCAAIRALHFMDCSEDFKKDVSNRYNTFRSLIDRTIRERWEKKRSEIMSARRKEQAIREENERKEAAAFWAGKEHLANEMRKEAAALKEQINEINEQIKASNKKVLDMDATVKSLRNSITRRKKAIEKLGFFEIAKKRSQKKLLEDEEKSLSEVTNSLKILKNDVKAEVSSLQSKLQGLKAREEELNKKLKYAPVSSPASSSSSNNSTNDEVSDEEIEEICKLFGVARTQKTNSPSISQTPETKSEESKKAVEIPPEKKIPDGAYYGNTKSEKLYTSMPDTVSDGDFYLYGDYFYCYREGACLHPNGWQVALTYIYQLVYKLNIKDFHFADKTKSSYGPILDEINGMQVTSISGLFQNCKNLSVPPTIPNTVTDMFMAFAGCESLVVAPAIPNKVKNLSYAFEHCKNLTVAPSIPAKSEELLLAYTFHGCTNLVVPPIVPEGASVITSMFEDCVNLKGALTINSTPEWHDKCLKGTQITEIQGKCSIKDEILKTR